MTDEFTTVEQLAVDFNRNGRGQPMIIPAEGGRPVAYNRPSSWGKRLEDMYGINMWEKRCIVAGIARTPSLIARAVALEGDPQRWVKADKDALNLIADEAKTAARANQAADIGTAEHLMTERVDLGHDLGDLPEPFASDMSAYRQGMAAHRLGVRAEWIECRMVCDELRLAGTADRIVSHDTHRLRVFDLKTGASIELAALSYAIQLAIYGHSDLYDIATGARTKLDLDQEVAYIGHLPAGRGEFHLYEVDIAAGWEAALLAADIDRWRKRKNLMVVKALTVAPVDRRAQLQQRCKVVAELNPATAAVMASTWPSGLSLTEVELTGVELSDAELNVIEAHIVGFETAVSAPFAQPVTNHQPVVETNPQPVVETPSLPDIQVDEGVEVAEDDPMFTAMKARYVTLDEAGHSWMAQVLGESIAAGRSIHMSTGRTLRRVRIVDGLTILSAGGVEGFARDLCHLATGCEAVLFDSIPLGAAVSIMSSVEAATFAGLAESFVADPSRFGMRDGHLELRSVA